MGTRFSGKAGRPDGLPAFLLLIPWNNGLAEKNHQLLIGSGKGFPQGSGKAQTLKKEKQKPKGEKHNR
jgi:hypothetical protein